MRAFRTRPRLLPQRLENLHQFGVDELIAADHVAGLERVVVAGSAADDAAGFAQDDLSGSDVPWLQVAFPVAVEAARRDASEIERCGAEPAQAGHPFLNFGQLDARQFEAAASQVRQ